ncbi:MAG: hypothetical protein ACRDGF_07485 [Chloroflexota bacterium]
MALLRLAGPLSQRQTEALLQRLVVAYPAYDLVPRSWEGASHGSFVRWCDTESAAAPLIVGLLQVTPSDRAAAVVELFPFTNDADASARAALAEFSGIMQSELAEQQFASTL